MMQIKTVTGLYDSLGEAQRELKKIGYGTIYFTIGLTPHERWFRAERERARKSLDALTERYGANCLVCGSPDKLLVDHIQPLSREGTSDIENLQPLCHECNFRKGLQIIDYRPYPFAANGVVCGYCERWRTDTHEMITTSDGGLSDICGVCWPELMSMDDRPIYREMNSQEIIFPLV